VRGRKADLVIGGRQRAWSDFTTASKTAFRALGRGSFVNVNVADFDAAKHGRSRACRRCARATLTWLTESLGGWAADDS